MSRTSWLQTGLCCTQRASVKQDLEPWIHPSIDMAGGYKSWFSLSRYGLRSRPPGYLRRLPVHSRILLGSRTRQSWIHMYSQVLPGGRHGNEQFNWYYTWRQNVVAIKEDTRRELSSLSNIFRDKWEFTRPFDKTLCTRDMSRCLSGWLPRTHYW